jgi:hypothetical protein
LVVEELLMTASGVANMAPPMSRNTGRATFPNV